MHSNDCYHFMFEFFQVDSSQVLGTPPGELNSSEDCMNVDSDCYESEYDFTEEEPEDDRDDSYEGKTDTDTATDTDDETDSRYKYSILAIIIY